MSELFTFATTFNDQGISYWDVSQVTNMSKMFEGASAFNQPSIKWDGSNITTMANMFSSSINR